MNKEYKHVSLPWLNKAKYIFIEPCMAFLSKFATFVFSKEISSSKCFKAIH